MTAGSQIAFLDMEASGLGASSWPIEAGWVFPGWPVRSVLIKPSPRWPLEAWQKQAERLHGITLQQLLGEGLPVLEIALMLNAALGSAQVYSDAPDYDGYWLYRLFEAAGVKANFQLLDFADLIAGITDLKPSRLIAEADRTFPHIHRAAADVLHMAEIYRLAVASPR